jgi:hypothetical protein
MSYIWEVPGPSGGRGPHTLNLLHDFVESLKVVAGTALYNHLRAELSSARLSYLAVHVQFYGNLRKNRHCHHYHHHQYHHYVHCRVKSLRPAPMNRKMGLVSLSSFWSSQFLSPLRSVTEGGLFSFFVTSYQNSCSVPKSCFLNM